MPISLVAKTGLSVAMILSLTFTEWFWFGVPTPVGILILLGLFPPTIIVQTGVALAEKYGGVEIKRAD